MIQDKGTVDPALVDSVVRVKESHYHNFQDNVIGIIIDTDLVSYAVKSLGPKSLFSIQWIYPVHVTVIPPTNRLLSEICLTKEDFR